MIKVFNLELDEEEEEEEDDDNDGSGRTSLSRESFAFRNEYPSLLSSKVPEFEEMADDAEEKLLLLEEEEAMFSSERAIAFAPSGPIEL